MGVGALEEDVVKGGLDSECSHHDLEYAEGEEAGRVLIHQLH